MSKKKFWPLHPDISEGMKSTEAFTGVFNGIAGTLWALNKLSNENNDFPKIDIISYLPLLE